VALLTVRVGSHRYTTPFVVRARRRRAVLVVMPETTWQARNRLEADGDGYPDVLPAAGRVSAARAFAGNGLPLGFAPGQSGVLQFLDGARLRYDLTTDLALSRGMSPGGLDRYRGILFAGAPRFVTRRVRGLMRAYVEGGGRLAWIGRGGFGWSVGTAGARELVGPRRSQPFGERVRAEPEAVPVAVLTDRIDFFSGVPGAFGPYGPLEESLRLPRGVRLLASAGTGADRPSVVVYRRGRGIVARIGIDGFGRALQTSPDAARIMRRLWVLLSR
jgi:hypothetical protein